MAALPTTLIDQSAGHINWPDVNKDGRAIATSKVNVAALVHAIGIELRHNAFTDEIEIHGRGHFKRLGDPEINKLWAEANVHAMQSKHGDFARLLDVVARENSYHPVLDYLKSLKWDHKARAATWLPHYLGAADTPLNRAIGWSVLAGMVRRVLEPGCPHDTMMVLEGPQGAGKSRAVRALGGRWYGDSLTLGQASREVIEQTRGTWLVEIAELAGQRRNEVEQVKAFLSRRDERARLAYGRAASVVPRQFILVATTNDESYLKDTTGARRFLPVTVGKIDLDALGRDRDQLFAEVYYQAGLWGVSNQIPAELWAAAAEIQESRLELTTVEAGVRELITLECCGFITKPDLREALGARSAKDWTQLELNALSTAMRKLGWAVKKQRRPGGKPDNVWTKIVPGRPAPWWALIDGKLIATPPASF
jgi:putative DNA primase/helicase